MSFPKLAFPLTIECYGTGYWIGKEGPFKYGEAITAFFREEDLADDVGDGASLMQELEVYLQTFGGYLHPYAASKKIPNEWFEQLRQSMAGCTINYGYHTQPGSIILVERDTFSTLRDFLYVELGKAILQGNTPRQCRLCGQWFLHVQGDRSVYCERIAPGETEKTCREVGARSVFEEKVHNDDTWRFYKRAYKKYYARVMKGNMSREDFDAWVERAAAERARTAQALETTKSAEKQAALIEALREELNRL